MGEIVDSAISFKIIPFLIPILFYFLGLNTETTELKKLITEKKSLMYGLTFQIICLPLVGIVLSNIFKTSIFSTAVVLVLLVLGGHISELGEVDMSQMGRIIGAVMAKGDGIDGSLVSKLVKDKIS